MICSLCTFNYARMYSTETHSVETPTLEKYFPGTASSSLRKHTVSLGKGLACHATFPGNIFLASTARFPGKIVHSLKATREAWRAL
jgi:hypothetical protein